MRNFRNINDVEDWLEPMDYEGFWYAIAPYDLTLQPRDHCDAQIASGEADIETVLDVLKYFARLELAKKFDLHWREVTPWLKLAETH